MANLGKKAPGRERATSGLMAGVSAVIPLDSDFIPGPKLRARLGISAVTLWRWRHDPAVGFPVPKIINGRLYFPSAAVATWLAKQPEAA